MSTKISATKAKEYINNYRQGLPAGSLRSAWLNRDFIHAVIALSTEKNLDGVRVYLAKYTESDPQQRFAEGDVTVILVPTENEEDLDEYHDYAKICPPHCDHDAGN